MAISLDMFAKKYLNKNPVTRQFDKIDKTLVHKSKLKLIKNREKKDILRNSWSNKSDFMTFSIQTKNEYYRLSIVYSG